MRLAKKTFLAALAVTLWPASQALADNWHPYSNGNLCMDVAWGANQDGAQVQIATCNNGTAQNWTFTNGSLQVFGNKCLDVTNGANQDGTPLQLWDCTPGNVNQQFTWNGKSFVWTAGNRCVDIPNNNASDGVHLRLWDCNGSAAQTWNGVNAPVTGGSSSSSSGGSSTSTSFTGPLKPTKNQAVCMDVAWGNSANGTAVQVATCNSSTAQNWTYDGSNFKVLGKCLDVPSGTDKDGNLLQLWDCNGSSAQKWSYDGTRFHWTGGNNKCLDIPNANATDGQRLEIWDCNGSAAQTWTIPGGSSGGGSTGGGSSGGTGWNLVWSDEFNASTLDTSKWNYEVNCDGGGNNEQECYVASTNNVYLSNGALHIKVIKQNYNGKPYTSGRINTAGKAMWTYGRFETSLMVPCGQGFWPAAWMLPQDNKYGSWPTSGELDIMEILGGTPAIEYGTAHFGAAWPNNRELGGTKTLSSGNYCGAFHQFALEWYADHATWFVDGSPFFTLTNTQGDWSPAPSWPFNQRFFFILNVAMGGNWPGAPDGSIQSGEMQVDYVRVYTHQ